MKNAVVMCIYNQVPKQLELAKEAVASVLAQDIPVDLFLIDNGSKDDNATWLWMQNFVKGTTICAEHRVENESPVKVGNEWMDELFNRLGYEYILGVPADVVLPPNMYREMLRWPRGVVTASMTGVKKTYGGLTIPQPSRAVNTCTPMAVVMIRKWVHQALIAKDGYFFDEGFFHYASDCDFALRLSSCGITGIQLDTEYWHYGSGSWRMLPEEKGKIITNQADIDRSYFEKKWGFKVADPEYGQSAEDINFRGERVDG